MTAKRMEVLAILAFIVACGFVIGGATTQSGGTQHAGTLQPASPSLSSKKAEEQFKNIQVLKGVPAEEIFPTMQFITASPGVDCDFGHVQGSREKARQM